jgi:hypothetical protein
MHEAARAAANNALALDPATPSAVRALAFLLPGFARYQERLDLAEKAVKLAPNDPLMQGLQAAALQSAGRFRDSLPFSLAAMELEPLSPGMACFHALALLTVGNSDEGMTLLSRTCARFPGEFGPWFFRAWAICLRDRPSIADNPFFTDEPLHLGLPAADVAALRALHGVGYLPIAERAAAIHRLIGPDMPMLWLGVAKAASSIGCSDAAFDSIFAAMESGRPIAAYSSGNFGMPRSMQSLVLFHYDAWLLHRDPRFARVCAHLNLVDYWMTSGYWPDCADEVPYDFRTECEKALAALR